MTPDTPTCLRCQSVPMERGFIVDAGDYNLPRVSRWVAGVPEKSFWSGLKLGDREAVSICTFRCPQCGYLESYAPADGSAEAR